MGMVARDRAQNVTSLNTSNNSDDKLSPVNLSLNLSWFIEFGTTAWLLGLIAGLVI